MIKIQVIGNLGQDARKNDVNGKAVINFSVAHTEQWKDAQGNQQKRTTWVECAYWSEKTGILPYLTKGTQVYVEGAPESDKYEGKDGVKAVLRCRVAKVDLLSRKDATDTQVPGNANLGEGQQAPELDMDLPF